MTTSKPDLVSDQLRRMILTGQIGPGERINVRALESDLGVSHIPIREAIHRLEAEGLIARRPNVGAVATQVSLDELDELYDFRRVLEPAVARRAVPLMTDENVAAVFQALERLESSEATEAGMDEYVKFHREFHWQILEPGASTMIERTLDELWRTSERYLRLLKGTVTHIADPQHEEMAAACRDRDAEHLADVLFAHLDLTGSAMREMLYGDDPPADGDDDVTTGVDDS